MQHFISSTTILKTTWQVSHEESQETQSFLMYAMHSNSIVMSSLSFVLINAYYQSNQTLNVIFEIKVSEM